MLSSGDAITLGITHHVTINGDDAWIKLEINSKVLATETADAAYQRINDMIQSKIIDAIESAAQTVINYENDNKEKN